MRATISIPILNKAGIAQISPANTAVGLTTDEPGAEQGEPDKYYPTGKRTYARIVPRDTIQGAALATVMKEDGCKKPSRRQRQGGVRRRPGHATSRTPPKAQGLTIVGNDGHRPEGAELPLARLEDQGQGRGLLRVLGGIDRRTTRCRCTRTSRRRCRTPSSTARTASARRRSPTRRRAASPPTSASRVKCTVATLDPDELPAGGQAVLRRDYKTTVQRQSRTRTRSTATRR